MITGIIKNYGELKESISKEYNLHLGTKDIVIDKGKVLLSEKFRRAVKEEFGEMNCKVELIINQGGIQSGEVKLKI